MIIFVYNKTIKQTIMEFLTDTIQVTKVSTRFMNGNKTSDVFDILADFYGMSEVCNDKIEWDDAIFSDGFISAMNDEEIVPVLGNYDDASSPRKNDKEFHHVVSNDKCYKVYFKEVK